VVAARPIRLALLGKPGSGKGTQAERISERLGVPTVALGDLLRQRAEDRDAQAMHLARLLERGELVPDDVILKVVTRAIDRARGTGYVLDGFPRTLRQADSDAVPVDAVVELDVPDDVARRRLRARASMGRADDADPGSIERRLRRYHHDTEPLVELYRRRGMLTAVDGTGSPGVVTDSIVDALAPEEASPPARR
jgi:adenylate kinase